MKVGRRIKEIRSKKRLSQAEAAKASGISQSYYNEIENEKAKCPIDTLEKICNGIGITLSDFFCENKLPKNFAVIKKRNNDKHFQSLDVEYYELMKEIIDKKIPLDAIRKILDAISLIKG